MTNEQSPTCLGYIGDYTTKFVLHSYMYGDHNEPL